MDYVQIFQMNFVKVLPSSIKIYLAPCGLLAALETAPEWALREFDSGQFSSVTSLLQPDAILMIVIDLGCFRSRIKMALVQSE